MVLRRILPFNGLYKTFGTPAGTGNDFCLQPGASFCFKSRLQLRGVIAGLAYTFTNGITIS